MVGSLKRGRLRGLRSMVVRVREEGRDGVRREVM